MRVIVPVVGPTDRRVYDALQATGYDWEAADVSASDDAYFQLLTALWRKRETFCIVEHDVIVRPDTLAELDRCEHDWCGFPVAYGWENFYLQTLGCVKFSAALQRRRPTTMLRVGNFSDADHPQRHWCRLDAWLQVGVLGYDGERKHAHAPGLEHFGWEAPSHGCMTQGELRDVIRESLGFASSEGRRQAR